MINPTCIKAWTEILNEMPSWDDCPICNGKVMDIFDWETPPCWRCNGWGKIPPEETQEC
jgi:hypothetical protein